ncbi:MAG TPA: cell filamentation protein Fic [Crocinitomix sp.]|nr:cell filamentation protein Fic [Crocinitomix sp.]
MNLQSIGYKALIEKLNIEGIVHWHYSSIDIDGHTHKIKKKTGYTHEIYPKKYAIEETIINHLEFALKYDGVNLTLLTLIFQKIDEQELLLAITNKPTGKYIRRLWYLYEFLMNKKLPIADLTQGNYVDLLEKEKYYTLENAPSIKRQRIRDNQLGNSRFCPTVRKTKLLQEYEAKKLAKKSENLLTHYSPSVIKRALGYLYTKETKSSFEIEKVKPSSSRIEKFISLLKEAHKDDFCTKEKLIELQNRIVDVRFQDKDYRVTQNYIGESIAYGEEKIHYVSPKPKDLPALMEGLITAHQSMSNSTTLSVIHATVIAYGFVYLHPFEDGNGRIHRFLVHNILARGAFTPNGMIFPLSAVMLKNPYDYDASLECFSAQILPLVDYTLDDTGTMKVENDTALFYRNIDMTEQVERLYAFIEKTIDEELSKELEFIVQYDLSKKSLQDIVDMPDRQIDLFIRFTLQNEGRLSENKRKKYFDFLTEKEIGLMEDSILKERSV